MASIIFENGTKFSTDIIIEKLAKSFRLSRALKFFSLFIGLGVSSIFIPVFHFVLVPSFLMLSIIVSIIQYKKIYRCDLNAVNCPVCLNSFKESYLYSRENSFTLYCFVCRSSLIIRDSDREN